MKKIIIFVSLSISSLNTLGMQSDNMLKNNKKYISFGKNNVILINSSKGDTDETKQISILQNPRNRIKRFIQDVYSGKKDINFQNEEGDSALTLACNYCFYNEAHGLIDQGIDVNLANSYGHTALMYISVCDDLSLLMKILDRGAIVTTQDNRGNTPLLWALGSRTIRDENLRLKIVETLINKDPSVVKQCNLRGQSALSIAKDKGFSEIEKLLQATIYAEKVLNDPLKILNTEGKSLLTEFSENLRYRRYSAPDILNTEEKSLLTEFSENLRYRRYSAPDILNTEEKSPLAESSENAEYRRYSAPDILNTEEKSQLAESSENPEYRRYSAPDIMMFSEVSFNDQLLCHKGDCYLEQSSPIEPNQSDSVEAIDLKKVQLRKAIESSNIELAESLINGNRELINEGIDEDGNTPLHIAVRNNSIEIVKLLLDKNVDINIKDNDGMTALHIAVLQKNLTTVNLLLKHKARPNLGNKNGTSPLMLAANIGSLGILKALIKYDAQVNATNHDKNNALIISLLSNEIKDLSVRYNVCAALISENPFIINQVNNEGQTAMSIAESRKFENIKQLIARQRAAIGLNKNNNLKKRPKKQIKNAEKVKITPIEPVTDEIKGFESESSVIKVTNNYQKEKVDTRVWEINGDHSETSKEKTTLSDIESNEEETAKNPRKTTDSLKKTTDFVSFWKNLIDGYKKFFSTKNKDDKFPMQIAKSKEEAKRQPALRKAIESNNDKLVNNLLKENKKLLNTPIDEDGNTPLLLAFSNKHEQVADMIMNYDDDIDFTYQNKSGETAWILVVKNRDVNTLDMLITGHCSGVNIADNNGNTPLILMLKSNNYSIAKTMTWNLLENYSDLDVNHQNKDKETALIVALKQNRLEIAALLLENPNLRLDITNEEGNSQLSLAMDVFQKTLETHRSEDNENLISKSLNILSELKKKDIKKAIELIIMNMKDLKNKRESDLRILNSFRNALNTFAKKK